MTDDAGAEATGSTPATGSGPSGQRRRRLRLSDPLESRAAEDRPESWGDRSDGDPAAHYVRERPPHHGD